VITYQLTIDEVALRRAFTNWKERLPKLNRLILSRFGNEVVGVAQQHFMTGQAIRVRTGRLRGSMDFRMTTDYEARVGDLRAGSNVKYAAMQEFGGTITPKKGKYLAIPIYRGAESTTMPRSPRDFSDLFFLRLAGKPFLARKSGRAGARLELMFALKTSVTIRPHNYLRNAFDWFFASGRAATLAESTTNEFIRENWGA
jgi:phage gpG-like protein